MCVFERGRGHGTVITDSILGLKKGPAVLPGRAHCGGDEEEGEEEEDADVASNNQQVQTVSNQT